MEFLTTDVTIIDRHTEPKIEDLQPGQTVPPKHEVATIQIQLTGSGDTRSITNDKILEVIMDRLKTIS